MPISASRLMQKSITILNQLCTYYAYYANLTLSCIRQSQRPEIDTCTTSATTTATTSIATTTIATSTATTTTWNYV